MPDAFKNNLSSIKFKNPIIFNGARFEKYDLLRLLLKTQTRCLYDLEIFCKCPMLPCNFSYSCRRIFLLNEKLTLIIIRDDVLL